jgi:sugar phosphate isomerase/epimerase
MKLSCIPVSYFRKLIDGEMSILDWIREAVEFGLDGIDVSILFFPDRDAKRLNALRERMHHVGLKLAILNTYSDLTHPDAVRRAGEIEQLKRDIEMASLLGAENVRVVSGQAHPETGIECGIQWALEGFLQAASTAEEHGIQLVYENHSKPGNWDYPDFSFPPDVFLRIADRLAGTPVKILFDTANPLAYGVEPLPILERVLDRVVCVHAADTSVRGHLQPSPIGKGLVPFNEIFHCLKHSRFEGWVSIEEASATGKAGVQSAVIDIRKAWNNA